MRNARWSERCRCESELSVTLQHRVCQLAEEGACNWDAEVLAGAPGPLSDVHIYVTPASGIANRVECATDPGPWDCCETRRLACSAIGRTVRITTYGGAMSLCEVELFGTLHVP